MKTYCCLSLVLLGILLLIGVSHGIDDEIRVYESKSFYVGTSTVSWQSAAEDCSNRQMKLVGYNSLIIDDFVDGLRIAGSVEHFWTSASSYGGDTDNEIENCVYWTNDRSFDKEPCGAENRYICEVQIQ